MSTYHDAPYTGTPTDAEIEAWYKRYPDRYRSDDEMRRVAFLNWAMTALPVDSALILNNITSFVRAAQHHEKQGETRLYLECRC